MTRLPREDGFTIVEAMVAVSMLAVALALTIQPVMGAMSRVADARVILVAENLAQAEIEGLRALDYEAVGLPGRTPSGVLVAERIVTVAGRTYSVMVDVAYAGSLTGLDVIPQGGDGVQGAWDPGVDYKVATVTVIGQGREHDPVVMRTIVAPRTIGAHEGIANARVRLAAYEPFAAGGLTLPSLKVWAPPAPPIGSGVRTDVQVFPAIPAADYVVSLDAADGWILHPDDVLQGADLLLVRAGTMAETTLRVYRPATLVVEVVDLVTGAAIPNARLTYTDLVRATTTSLAPGVYRAEGLIPNAYDITVTADGYVAWTLPSVDIPSAYPASVHQTTTHLMPLAAVTTTTTIPVTTTAPTATTTTLPLGALREIRFEVKDSTGRVITGAAVSVDHPNLGTLATVTDATGRAYINLERGYTYTAVASTVWGHGPGTASFDPQATGNVALRLTRPSGHGLMALKGGRNAEFVYRPAGSATWVVVPPNNRNEASFVGSPGNYDVAKRCTRNGALVNSRVVSVTANTNRSVSLSTNCP